MFVFLTLKFLRLFYSAEYKILTVVWQLSQWKPNFQKHSFYGMWLYLSQSATIALLWGSWAISVVDHMKSHASHASKKEGNQYFGRAVRIAVRISDPDK